MMESPHLQTISEMPRKKAPGTTNATISAKRPRGNEGDSGVRMLKIHYSDGTEVFQDGVNAPQSEMLDPTPDKHGALNYMRPVGRYERKEIEWLRQLAEGLIRETDKELERQLDEGARFFFTELPAGYRLYEYVRAPNGGNTKSRKDTYLYGHPKGPRKRFRSPSDFLPHILWLSRDTTRNPANCKCHACKGSGMSTTGSLSPIPSTLPAQSLRKLVVPQSRRPDHATAGIPTAASLTTFIPTQPAVFEGILLSSPTHREREQDLHFPGLAIYRFGEQVWFQTGPHWAIGVVVGVPVPPATHYQIHPLNSPLLYERTRSHNNIPASQLRPWLAWSTPPVTNSAFETQNKVEYESLPWEQQANAGSVEVDASILRSRDVDVSYTLIDRLNPEDHYSGVYHGAERFWIGDAIRMKATTQSKAICTGSGNEILVVSSIQDFTPSSPFGVRNQKTGVVITGDVYRLTSHAQAMENPPGLPTAVRQDLAYRLGFTTRTPEAPYWGYAPVARKHSVKLEDIKGRWYPGSSLYQIMHGIEQFNKLAQTASISTNDWDSTGSRMNEMGTGGVGSTLGWRRYEHRHQAFNKAIPSHIVFTPSGGDTRDATQGAVAPQGVGPEHIAEATSTPSIHSALDTARHPAPPETIDLTQDDNEGMEFLNADHDSMDEEFMKRMGEDAASFLADEGEVFYSGL